MADIKIVQEHKLSHEQARAAAEQVAQKIAAEFDMAFHWEGEVLHFTRSGVTGSLALEPQRANMHIKLGFLMGAFSGVIEQKVRENMAKVFGAGK